MAKDLRSKKINQIMYISIGCVIACLILFIILFTVLNNKNESEKIDLQIGKSNSPTENAIQDASSSIGKKVDEMNDYEEINDGDSVQVQTTSETQSNNQMNQNQINSPFFFLFLLFVILQHDYEQTNHLKTTLQTFS